MDLHFVKINGNTLQSLSKQKHSFVYTPDPVLIQALHNSIPVIDNLH